MKRRASALALAATLLGGCTITRHVQRPQTLEELNPIVWKKPGAITLLYNRPAGATSAVPPALPATADAARAGGEEVPLLEVSNLRGYEVKRRGRGALEGFGLGFLVGALAGAAIGSAMGSDEACNGRDGCNLSFTASDKALAIGFVGAVAGAIVGPLIGLLRGHTDRYVFSDGDGEP
jgi:hypothetical protein